MSSVPHVRPARRHPTRARAYTVFRFSAIGVVVVTILGPLLWMVLAALKDNVDIFNSSRIFSFAPTLKNFVTVFAEENFLDFIVNSLLVGAVSTVISLAVALPASYSISRFVMRRSKTFVLVARIMPAVSLLVPWYFLFSRMGIVGSYTVLVITHMFVSVPLMIYILVGFFDGLPLELEESGQVDGLTPIGAFLRISVPLSMPGVATACILAFIFSWNNFLFALVLASNSTRTLPLSLYNFVRYASVDWGGLMAASVVITTPIIVIALFLQRYIVAGLAAGATKG